MFLKIVNRLASIRSIFSWTPFSLSLIFLSFWFILEDVPEFKLLPPPICNFFEIGPDVLPKVPVPVEIPLVISFAISFRFFFKEKILSNIYLINNKYYTF